MKDILLKYHNGSFEVYDSQTHTLDGHLEITLKNDRKESYAYRPLHGGKRPPAPTIPKALSAHFGDEIVISIAPIM